MMLANLESLNSHLIANGISQNDRIIQLAREAKRQYQTFVDIDNITQQNIKRLNHEN